MGGPIADGHGGQDRVVTRLSADASSATGSGRLKSCRWRFRILYRNAYSHRIRYYQSFSDLFQRMLGLREDETRRLQWGH
jgi:hypothetical protein